MFLFYCVYLFTELKKSKYIVQFEQRIFNERYGESGEHCEAIQWCVSCQATLGPGANYNSNHSHTEKETCAQQWDPYRLILPRASGLGCSYNRDLEAFTSSTSVHVLSDYFTEFIELYLVLAYLNTLPRFRLCTSISNFVNCILFERKKCLFARIPKYMVLQNY